MNQDAILWAEPLSFDLNDQSIQLDGKPVELGPKIAALLRVLMEAPLRVVTKEELFDTVWDGRFVSEAVLTTAVKELRRALGDDSRQPVFIGTVHGRGYRFLKTVEVKPRAAPETALRDDLAPAGVAPPSPARSMGSRISEVWAGLTAALVIAGVAIFAPMLASSASGGSPRTEVASIAVLPFEDLSPGGDRRYLADGIADEILNVLLGVDGLATTSRTASFAYRDRKEFSIQQIGRELDVGHVLEGSIKANDNRLRLSVRLVDARTGRTAWSRDYDRELSVENLFRLEDEVAERVVSQLRTGLARGLGAQDAKAHTAPSGATNLRAYDLYLRSRDFFLQRKDEEQGIEMMRQATQLDPGFARAWEMLGALSFVAGDTIWTSEGRAAVDKALALDPDLSLAHAVRGMMIAYSQPVNWEEGIASLEKALELDPENTTALLWLGNELHKLGYLDRSQQLLERCLQLDPAYDTCRLHLSWVLHMRGKTDAALEEHRRLLRDGGQSTDTMFLHELMVRGETEQARQTLERLTVRQPIPDIVLQALRSPPKNMTPVRNALREWAMTVDMRYKIYPVAVQLGVYEVYSPISRPNFALWIPEARDFRKSPNFKWFIRTMNIEPYWRAHGFPQQCWPVGEGDFECE